MPHAEARAVVAACRMPLYQLQLQHWICSRDQQLGGRAAVLVTSEAAGGRPELYQALAGPSAAAHHIHWGPRVSGSVSGRSFPATSSGPLVLWLAVSLRLLPYRKDLQKDLIIRDNLFRVFFPFE